MIAVTHKTLAVSSTGLLLIVIMVLGAGTSVHGSPTYSVSYDLADNTSNAWFVELAGHPLADYSWLTPSEQAPYRTQLNSERQNFETDARNAGLYFTERFTFDTLFNGLSINIDPSNIEALAKIPGVTHVYPVETISIPQYTQVVGNPDLATAVAMTGADIAQSELGYTGAGVKVAIMDTGVDYNHPDLGGCFGARCRVFTGWDFVGDAFNANPADPGFNPVPHPGPNPMDCNGHGTHVAGIVGANGGVKGVAPGVTFGAYRVFGCEGSTTADIMIAAMEMVLRDGMNVLNMSIGSAFQWPQYPTATAADRLVRNGIVVVASIGNNGPNGLYAAGAPGIGDLVIGVASYDNTFVSTLTFNANPGGQQVGYLPITTTPDPPTSGTSASVVFVGRGCNTDPYLANPVGQVALIERGACTFNEKYQKAATSGAVGVVIYNNIDGIFAGGGIVSRGIFGIGISKVDGLAIRNLTPPVTLTWTTVRINSPNPTGGLISSFSSYGPTPDLKFKPDIGAPGGLIRSTFPLALGGYAIISGTSMSSPHVAGGVALYLQAHPGIPVEMIRDILQNSAKPALWSGNPSLGLLEPVHRQGAGMLQIDKAILATTSILPGKLALGQSIEGPATRSLLLHNQASSSVTYGLSHTGAISTTGTITPSFTTGFATVQFTQNGVAVDTVTVPPGGDTDVTVTITANSGLADNSLYGGYLVFTPSSGPALRVPYQGYKGNYLAIPALTPTIFGFPWLAKLNGTSYVKQGPGATFALQDGEFPIILYHLDHQVRYLKMEVFDTTTGASKGNALYVDFHGRNSQPNSFFAFTWDGTTFSGTVPQNFVVVPDGSYLIKVSVLKALGDPESAADIESWTSPSFTIGR
jgi:subtilisin family serine protease